MLGCAYVAMGCSVFCQDVDVYQVLGMLSNSLLGQDQGEQGREIKPACAVLKWSIKRKEVGGLGNPRAANC